MGVGVGRRCRSAGFAAAKPIKAKLAPDPVAPGELHQRVPVICAGVGAGEIETVLRECGMKEITFLDHPFPFEFCDDCGMPLYPNAESEVVHPELPEQGHDAPSQTLH